MIILASHSLVKFKSTAYYVFERTEKSPKEQVEHYRVARSHVASPTPREVGLYATPAAAHTA